MGIRKGEEGATGETVLPRTGEHEELDTVFEIRRVVNENILSHCAWHQPMQNPEIKRAIDEIKFSFKIKMITSGICSACEEVLMKNCKK